MPLRLPALPVTLEDGTQVFEPPTFRETLPNGASYLIIDHMDQRLDDMAQITIPDGHVFLMGDNRDHSADSRAAAYDSGLGGPVPLADVGGRAEFITFSLDGRASWNPLTWWPALRGDRAWTSLRPELQGRPARVSDPVGPNDDGTMGASPTRISSPELRFEAWRALTWTVVVGIVVLAVYISQSLLVIFGAMVFATMVDGGARLLGRVLQIGRGWRIGIVLLAAVAFLVWLSMFAGSQISQQAAEFPAIVEEQARALFSWMREQGFQISMDTVQSMASTGRERFRHCYPRAGRPAGRADHAVADRDHRYLCRGRAAPVRARCGLDAAQGRAATNSTLPPATWATRMRRLMFGRLVGMVFEGVFTYIMLLGYGLVTGDTIPMAALLAILTGLLAFVPNIGALISGALMVLVGFSGGAQMGIYTIVVYFAVQNIDGYIVIPMIARKTVDLAPALVLAMQLIMGILFGILGLFLADPLLAMIKVALEERAKAKDAEDATALDETARAAGETHTLENDPA